MTNIATQAAALSASSRIAGTPKDVLDDLVCLAFNAMAYGRINQHTGGYKHVHCVPSYMQDLAKYQADPQAWSMLQDMYLAYLGAVKDAQPFADVLGEPYSAHVGQIRGQFLTPSSLATNAATMANSGDDSTSVVRLIDQCCGAGALLLGSLRDEYQRHGRGGIGRMVVYASDIDTQMCRLASVQIAYSSMLHGLPVLVLHVQNIDAISQHALLGKDDGLVLNAIRNV